MGRGSTTRHPTTGQNTTPSRPTQHKPTQDETAQQETAQQGNDTTAPKGSDRPLAPQNKTRGQSTRARYQRQHREEKRRQHGATGHAPHDGQQHTENRHNH